MSRRTIRLLRACPAWLRRGAVLAMLALLASASAARAQDMDLRVTPQIERCITAGLDYLAKTQTPEGCWPAPNGTGSGVVGLHLLTFLAHGEIPDEGKYGKVMRKAVEYIVKHQEPNGLLAGPGNPSPMYNHGFATLALAEVYGMIDYPALGPALKKATQLIISTQNSQGGWRYSVGSTDSDTTVSGAQMVGLRAAATGGIEVPLRTVQRGVAFYKSTFCPGGGFGYTGPSGPNDIRGGIGLLVLTLSGAFHSTEAKITADWLLQTQWNGANGQYPPYRNYYCAQALLQAGGKYWRRWTDVMTPVIIESQSRDGSWPDYGLGVSLASAFNMLALEVNYYYLPIYQR